MPLIEFELVATVFTVVVVCSVSYACMNSLQAPNQMQITTKRRKYALLIEDSSTKNMQRKQNKNVASLPLIGHTKMKISMTTTTTTICYLFSSLLFLVFQFQLICPLFCSRSFRTVFRSFE